MSITVLVLVFLNIYSARATRDLMFKAKCSSSQDKLKVVTSSFSGVDALTQETTEQIISVIGDMNVTRLLVTDAAGRTLYDSVPGQSAAGKVPVGVGRRAKKAGVDVTCETGPHYLTMDDSCLQEDGRFKMNPPLRGKEDREALLEGLLDGTIDMIATDHAPHSAEEKSRGLAGSAFGVVGLETAFPVLYTKLVLPGILPLETLIDRMALAPRRRFGIPLGSDFTVWDLEAETVVAPERFLSMGKATPFAGWRLRGVCKATVCDGKFVYRAED